MMKELYMIVVVTVMLWNIKEDCLFKSKVHTTLLYCGNIHTNIGIGINIVKGITHCLLPECDNLTWPFENYCGKTHASIGMDRGLSSKNNYY